MKKILLLTFGFVYALCFSQTQDLATLAAGEHVGIMLYLTSKTIFTDMFLYILTGNQVTKQKNSNTSS
ncbi:hypothetical protein [Chryseobacterium gregarium]|uniref:hypothetical protein n=1 Tax=Chryseobacterium gregarium TaxID=456299 RepID=UPI0004088E44|nr:hypothetical protein [Chryseobacterium gregarium]